MKTILRRSILGLLLLGLTSLPVRGQNSITEIPFTTKQPKEKSDVWVLDITFKSPRIIKVFVPGQGTRIYWYMWYQVINRTDAAHRFVPYFEIVTHDFPAAYPDRYHPTVKDAVAKLEDATGYQNIKDSVTISTDLIPVSKPDALPRAVTGLAIWEACSVSDARKRDANAPKELTDTTRFSVFIRGLSNGFVQVNPLAPGQPPITRYKTLQINFKRKGDRFSVDSKDIEYQPSPEWLYRPGNTTIVETKDKK